MVEGLSLILWGVLSLIGIILISKTADFLNNIMLYRRDWRTRYMLASLAIWTAAGLCMGLVVIWFITRLMHFATH